MILALIFGLLGGLGLVFLFEYLDNSVKSSEDVEKYSGLPTLGVIPEFSPSKFKKGYKSASKSTPEVSALLQEVIDQSKKGERTEPGEKRAGIPAGIKSIELITHVFPKSNYAENYRSIRTTLLLSTPDGKLKSLLVSSALPQEGKTATISNLAVTLAQANKRVVIVDSDLRKPRLNKIFEIKNTNGLTNYLSSTLDIRDLVKPTKIPNLFLINSGPVPPNPVELLDSEKMNDLIDRLKQGFDYILYDVPPVLSVSDAIVLGTKIDGMILVAWGGKTSRDALRQTKDKLDVHKIKCLGVVLNNINVEERGYYHMRHYYDYYG
jgi:capsular exopolysaccharide synthesis family protein